MMMASKLIFLCAVTFNFADVHLYHRFLVTADNGQVDDHDEGIDDEVMCDASVTAVHVYKPHRIHLKCALNLIFHWQLIDMI